MKAKDAIKSLLETPSEEKMYARVCHLYRTEAKSRIELRGHGKRISPDLVESVANEMAEWIKIVGLGVGLPEDNFETILNIERGILFSSFKMRDPVAQKQMDSMTREFLRGGAPINVLTRDGLRAISSMMLGNIITSAREISEQKKKEE